MKTQSKSKGEIMNERLKDIFFEDNGDFVSGVSKFFNDILYVTYSDSALALQYDFSSDPGEEFVQLTVIHERNVNSKTVPESELVHFYIRLGESATDSKIESIKNRMKPKIDEFKKLFDNYHSGDNAMRCDSLQEKYDELNDWCDECVEEIGLGQDGMRGEDETAEDVYYADSEVLDMLVSPKMTDQEIEAIAIEEIFVNGTLFHPAEIEGVLLGHRDYLLDQTS
jgi:hypothetical protein